MLPTFGDRHAITLWYYDQAERTDAVKRAREEGSAKKVATASVASQQTAKVRHCISRYTVQCVFLESALMGFIISLVCRCLLAS